MKKLLLLLIALPYICFSQSPPNPIAPFDVFYYDSEVKEVIQSKDGNYIVLFYSYGSGEHLIKLDSIGTTIWSKPLILNNSISIDTCYDNGFIIAGSQRVMKTNQYGDSLWSIPFPDVRVIKSTQDSCFLIATDPNTILKVDSLGSILYQTQMDTNVLPNSIGWTSINDILLTDDGVVVVGTYENYSDPMGGTLFGGYLAKFNNQGTHQWTQEFSGWYYDYMNQVMSTSDGGYALIGSSESFCSNSNNINSFWLIKTDSLGNVEWEKNNTHCDEMTFGSVNSFDSFDSGYIVVGQKFNSSDSSLIIITDSIGNEINRLEIAQLSYPKINDNIIFGGSGGGSSRILKIDPNAIGCVNPIALNYDSTALIDDGSCVYGKTYVPDDMFEVYLEAYGMGDSIVLNDSVSTYNIKDIISLGVVSQNIADLTGIEDFVSLQDLNCYGNQLTNLDVSQNIALTNLRCDWNQLTSLDVSNNTALTLLGCGDNQLTSLVANTALRQLGCENNQLTTLDVSQNMTLEALDCSSNQLTSLDFRNINILSCGLNSYGNPNLYCIDVDNVLLANVLYGGAAPTVDTWTSFSTNCATAFGCTDSIALNYNSLATIDDSSCTYPPMTYVPDDNFEQALINLGYDNILDDSVITASIDTVTYLSIHSSAIADLTGIEDFTALITLWCGENSGLTSVDVSNNTVLEYLNCNMGSITSVDVSGATALTNLECAMNNLTSLNVSNNTNLTSLSCYTNDLTSLNVSNNTALTYLDCHNNQLTSLDIRNGNNTNMYLNATNNYNLFCIDVDDPVYSTTNWTNIDAQSSFAITCSPEIGYTYVPDNNFEQALINLGYDAFLDDYVFTSSINTITSLSVAAENISDLTGIEDFTALIALYCDSNQLTSLDVSQNTALFLLDCSYNQLTSLDISQNTALTHLYCLLNPITSLDVSANTVLTKLHSHGTQLTTLDLSNNTALTYLVCDNNQLTSLDLSNNTALIDLYCSGNPITSLDVRNGNNTNMNFNAFLNPNLFCISVDDPTYSSANWTNIDSWAAFSSNCAIMTYVPDNNFEAYLENNGMGDGIVNNNHVLTANIDMITHLSLASKNISDLTGIEDFTALTNLDCEDNQLSSLNVSNNTALTHLKSRYNQLTSLDISNNTALTYLECDENLLTSLDVSNNMALTSLSCTVNQLTSLDVSNNTALIELDCYQNQLTSLDVSNNTNLTALSTRENYLTVLDVSQNTALIGLGCDDNQLTSLDVSNNTALEGLECFRNQLTSLDVSNNTALEELYCFENQLTNLDLSNNTTLSYLECEDNQLTSLDLRNGNNTNMITFSSTNNPNLICINVDDAAWSTVNWTVVNGNIDVGASFSPTLLTSTQTACDSYSWSVDGNTYTTSGTYTNVSTNANGCDHTETLHLTINNSTSSTDTHVACDEFMWYCDGNTYTSSNNTATYVYTNAAGCDSTVTLDLTINSSTSNSTTATACDSYTWSVDGNTYTTSGTYTDVSTNASGCDHTETLNLTINNSSLSSTLTTACDTYTWDGTDYTSSGAYTWTGTNAAGCDSVATLHLTIHNSSTSSEDVISCDSLVWNGTTYTTSGTYTWAGVNAVGCDSIATLNFTGGVTSTITQDEDSLYSSVYPSGVDYSAQWLNIDTETKETWLMDSTINFGPRFDCNYILVTTTENGCVDTTDVFFFAEFAGQIYDLKVSPNPTRGLINIKYVNERNQFVRIYFANSNGVVLDEFISSENEMNIDISNYPSGIYYVYFSSEEHCSSAEQQITRKIILNK